MNNSNTTERIKVIRKATRFRQAVERLWYWQHGDNPTNFTSLLFTLMQKADAENFARLALAFPEESMAYKLWCASESSPEFFRKFGIDRCS